MSYVLLLKNIKNILSLQQVVANPVFIEMKSYFEIKIIFCGEMYKKVNVMQRVLNSYYH